MGYDTPTGRGPLLETKPNQTKPNGYHSLPPRALPVLVPVVVPQVLYKDAVYAALAVGAYELYDYLDWGAWLTDSLLQVRQYGSTRTAVDRLLPYGTGHGRTGDQVLTAVPYRPCARQRTLAICPRLATWHLHATWLTPALPSA